VEAEFTCRIPGNLLRNRPAYLCVVRVSGDGQEKMVALSDLACKQCGGRMELVADISPWGREPGLRAFVCSECGTVESVLIYPDHHFGPSAAQ
jgi:DNA-directed RNA polymerase subunit RPC12/RpoP